jgi:hypothetical protein
VAHRVRREGRDAPLAFWSVLPRRMRIVPHPSGSTVRSARGSATNSDRRVRVVQATTNSALLARVPRAAVMSVRRPAQPVGHRRRLAL